MGAENSKQALDMTKNAALTGGTMTLNLALVSAQLSLIASAAVASFVLDGVILTKNVGTAAVATGFAVEKAVEERIYSMIEKSRELAKVPVDKLNEHANGFLDIANAVVNNYLQLPEDEDPEKPDSTIGQRVTRLAHRIVWKTNANNGESRDYNAMPKEVLVRSVRHCSHVLNEYLQKLSNKSAEVLPDAASQRLAGAAEYVKKLDEQFENAKDIYEVKDEVFEEAKTKLNEISGWLNSAKAQNEDPLDQ